eukprot:TRINITY_DN21256_c0_g1_i2.p1 TRINITY_DN21256_c0_g1~~TRINITY_DN21256_c0_g1_i2.p1  ORF type:complete len:212 (+),score=17.23 TRINITY_DN21256_c0_g1_i2:260-895(+)
MRFVWPEDTNESHRKHLQLDHVDQKFVEPKQGFGVPFWVAEPPVSTSGGNYAWEFHVDVFSNPIMACIGFIDELWKNRSFTKQYFSCTGKPPLSLECQGGAPAPSCARYPAVYFPGGEHFLPAGWRVRTTGSHDGKGIRDVTVTWSAAPRRVTVHMRSHGATDSGECAATITHEFELEAGEQPRAHGDEPSTIWMFVQSSDGRYVVGHHGR